MRVFVECKSCGEKVFLDDVYERPSQYPDQQTLSCSNGHQHIYYPADLVAETGGNAAAAGAILGGAVGALGGPIGVAIGAGVGGAVGQNQDQQENERVEKFNQQYPE